MILVQIQLLPQLGLRQLPQLLKPTHSCADESEQTSWTCRSGLGILNHDQIPGFVVVSWEPAGRTHHPFWNTQSTNEAKTLGQQEKR